MALWILLALQLAATALGFAYLWRRQRSLSAEIARLREALAALERAPARRSRPRLAEPGAVAAPVTETAGAEIVSITPAASARADSGWRFPAAQLPALDVSALTPDTARGVALGAAAAAPALGFFFGLDAAVLTAAGVGVATAMMLMALRHEWRAAAWAGAITAAAWAAIGVLLGAAHAAPITYSVFVAFAGAAGLAHAHLRRAAPGSAMALAMATAALALASQIGVISAAGGAFAVIVAAAAIVGALSLRLEGIHFAAFGAAWIGLFVLSGQDAAAIWFTPATALTGALFLGVAAVRAPYLGARGVALAGLGALAPLLAIGVLHLAQHGLNDRVAAAAAFAALAPALIGVLALAASRRSLAALKATAWALALGAYAALAAAICLAAPAPIAAPAFAAAALGLGLLNLRLPAALWRTLGCLSAAFAAAFALASAQMLLGEAPGWPAAALTLLGLAAPAGLLGAAAALAHRADAALTAGVHESAAVALAVIAANLAARLFFSGGATLLNPIGFVEAGAHIALWLAAALLLAWRARRGSRPVRLALSNLLGAVSLAASAVAAGLWLTPYWDAREAFAGPIAHPPLGFLAPAILFWAHWAFWRRRGADTRARVAFAAAALLSAAFITQEATRWQGAPDWVGALLGAIAFAAAIVGNFAPGITPDGRRLSYREKYFHRDRRRQQRS